VKKLYVIEELDPFIEEQVKAMGIEVTGKDIFPYTNEFDPGVVEQAIKGKVKNRWTSRPWPFRRGRPISVQMPASGPLLCPGQIEGLCDGRHWLLHRCPT